MFLERIILILLGAATALAASGMSECNVYQKTWSIIDYYNKADLSVDENYFPTSDPPLFSKNLVINMGSMTVSTSQYLEAYEGVAVRSMQANPTWVECSPWEWCHMHVMTTYYGQDGGSISQRQFWTFVYNPDCEVVKFIILMEARDNDILVQAFSKNSASEL